KYIVQSPPTFAPGLFQEHLPLIRFRDSDLIGSGSVSSGPELSNYIEDDTMATSSNYSDELASFQLLPSENPEDNEENDEKRQWSLLGSCTGLLVKSESFIARFKRPYEAAMGSARSAGSQTMRKAAKSYYFMRPQNQTQRST
ncbi:hypothetical protein V1527DRAFT_55643, partial [Lipomyces starkeyi]